MSFSSFHLGLESVERSAGCSSTASLICQVVTPMSDSRVFIDTRTPYIKIGFMFTEPKETKTKEFYMANHGKSLLWILRVT